LTSAAPRPIFAVCGHGTEALKLLSTYDHKESDVRESVLEAVKLGDWDFEPEQTASQEYDATVAMPGTKEKLAVMAERISRGLPIWHPGDRTSYDEASYTRKLLRRHAK